MSHVYTTPPRAGNLDTEEQVRRRRILAWKIAMIMPLLVVILTCGLLEQVSVPWQTASGILTLSLVTVISVTDVLWQRIPNWATYSAVAWALAINAYSSTLGSPPTNEILGAVGITNCLVGATVPFVAMFVVFSLTGGGAGDVKLTAALGAYLGLSLAVDAILFSFIFAGGYALTRAIWFKGPIATAHLIWRSIGNRLLPIWILPPSKDERAFLRHTIPLGPSFALGTVLVLFELKVAAITDSLGYVLGA